MKSYIIKALCFILILGGFGCCIGGFTMQCILQVEKFGFMFAGGHIIVPHWSIALIPIGIVLIFLGFLLTNKVED